MSLEIVVLIDDRTGSTVRVVPGFGMNCFDFTAISDDQPVRVVWSEPDFASGRCRASGSGIPLLFPFPGRIRGTQLQWNGVTYTLPAGDGLGNAIHGFVLDRPWRVLEQTTARVVARFHASVDAPQLLDSWPADFRITATYEVTGTTLKCGYVFDNPDDHALPCGFGTHPYFRLPLGGRSAAECVVRLPVASSWELENMNATGVQRPLEQAAEFQQGLRFEAMQFDNVFGDLQFNGETCGCAISDPNSSHTLHMTFGRPFRECVVYTPPHRAAICIEPYTCVPDPFRLAQQGVDAGLQVLQPGDSVTTNVEICLD